MMSRSFLSIPGSNTRPPRDPFEHHVRLEHSLSLALSLGLAPQAYTPCSVFKRVNVGVGSQWILDKSFVLFRSQESRHTACNYMMGRFYFVWNTEHG